MISIGYKSILPAILTVTIFPRPIDNLQELANTVLLYQKNFFFIFSSCVSLTLSFKKFQNFQIGSAGADFKIWMAKSTDPNLLKISEKFSSYHFDFDAAFKKMSGGEFAMLEGEQFLQASIRTHFTNK